ncbi:LysR substrate-binding domain-containing protein [Maritimibacter sp.]|uniref:LysR substrate-binding domain-containing protein n=1 Tax=Maritimibacter sp. TaxID=2003363 RepID=UPI0022A70412|nr:LysR substrate-binding domain-containing protein [Maritimibacter sp.]
MDLRAIATPEIAEAVLADDKDMLRQTHVLLHVTERVIWASLFEIPALPGLRSRPLLTFENYTMFLQTVSRGLGIALAPVQLIKNDLAKGRLVTVSDMAVKSRSVGYLVYQQQMENYPPLVAFRDWLRETIADDIARTNGGGDRQ